MLKLRPGQQEVAAYRGGYLAVPAVPGAGKTTVLAHLGGKLIAEGCTGRGKLLIVTYMNSSVANFKARLAGELEERGLSPTRGYEVKTLHSLALAILKENPAQLLISDELRILEPSEQNSILRELTRNWIANYRSTWEAAVYHSNKENPEQVQAKLEKWEAKTFDFIKSMVSYFKCLGLTAEELQRYLPALPEESFLRWAIEVFNLYRDRLAYMGVQDFDDLIYHACTLLKTDSEVLKRLQKRWTYIFEDEAQDSNPLQEQILLLLAGEKGNLVRVGDSNQSVMGTFTVADPALFRRFCRRPGVTRQPLLYSSRSSRDIINLANHLVHWANTGHPVPACRAALEKQSILPVPEGDPFPNPRPEHYTIGTLKGVTNREELAKVARQAARYVVENPAKTTAVLVPDKYTLQDMAEQLTLHNTPYREISGSPGERRRTARALGSIIDYLARPHRGLKLVEALAATLLPELAGEEFTPVKEFLAACPLEDLLYPPEGGQPPVPEEVSGSLLWPGCLYALKRVHTWLAASRIPPESLVLFLAADLGLEAEELAIAQRIALQIKEMLRENPAWRLSDLALELKARENMFDRFTDLVYDRKGYIPEPGLVNLVTYHKAKGLEWDTVFLTSLTSDNFPSRLNDYYRDHLKFLKQTNPHALAKAELKALLEEDKTISPLNEAKTETIGERLRLLYVGITRARENLLFSFPDEIYLPGLNRPIRKKPAEPLLVLKRYMEEQKNAYR